VLGVQNWPEAFSHLPSLDHCPLWRSVFTACIANQEDPYLKCYSPPSYSEEAATRAINVDESWESVLQATEDCCTALTAEERWKEAIPARCKYLPYISPFLCCKRIAEKCCQEILCSSHSQLLTAAQVSFFSPADSQWKDADPVPNF